MNKINLLLSGLGGALFPYLHDRLSSKYEIYYIDSDPTLLRLYPDYNFFVAPPVTDSSYFGFVKELIERFSIQYYIPLIDEEIIEAKRKEAVLGIVVVCPTESFCRLALNKFDLMKRLEKCEISHIDSCLGDNFTSNIDFPIFVKPISGRGSRGIKKIVSQKQLEAYYILEGYKPENVLIQELIEGTEYTIGAVINQRNDLVTLSIKKVIKKKGITQVAVNEHNELIEKKVRKIVSELQPRGPINIQLFFTDSGECKIFEINPRFSTTTIMSYAGGVDEISYYIENLNTPFLLPPVQPKPGITLHRRWESVFYDN